MTTKVKLPAPFKGDGTPLPPGRYVCWRDAYPADWFIVHVCSEIFEAVEDRWYIGPLEVEPAPVVDARVYQSGSKWYVEDGYGTCAANEDKATAILMFNAAISVAMGAR